MTLEGWSLVGPDFANAVVWISRHIHTSEPKSASVHGQATGVTHTATLDHQNPQGPQTLYLKLRDLAYHRAQTMLFSESLLPNHSTHQDWKEVGWNTTVGHLLCTDYLSSSD